MSIADHPTWVQAIDDGVAAMQQAYADRGWYDSHDLINWLIDQSEPVLKEIIESYRLRGDGAPVQDPYLIATRQVANYLRDHKGQERIGRHKSYRKAIQTDPPRVGGYSDVTVWRISTGSSGQQAVIPPNGSSSGGMTESPEIPGALFHDRGRGPVLPDRMAVAKELARRHFELEAGLTQVFLIADQASGDDVRAETIKLLEVNAATVAAGIMPLHFGAAPASGISYPSIILEVTPDEFDRIQSKEMKLPEGWTIGEELPRP